MINRMGAVIVMPVFLLSINLASADRTLQDVAIPESIASIKAGAETVTTLCVSCHSLKYIRFRNLLEIDFTQAEVDGIRAEKTLNQAFSSLMDEASLKTSYGKSPPDLSMFVKARHQGGQYVYSFLTGYYTTPEKTIDNKVFSGVRMPDVLGYAEAAEQDKKQIEQTAVNITAFLTWAADPYAAKRRTIGYWVILYCIILTGLFYILKYRAWKKLESTQVTVPEKNG
jgi:cytochrome c1